MMRPSVHTGEIFALNLPGQYSIVVNNPRIAHDMMEKKSSIYSSRPVIPVGGELVGWNRTLALLPYGNTFREYRRMIFQLIGSRKNMERFAPLIDSKTRDFVTEVYREPEDLLKHIRK